MVGGVKGIRILLPTKMMTPIVADAFGYSERDTVYLSVIFFVGTVIGLVLTYVFLSIAQVQWKPLIMDTPNSGHNVQTVHPLP